MTESERNRVDRDRISFHIDPNDPKGQEGSLSWREPLGTKEEIDEKAEEYGFPSRAAFLRCMLRLGMNTLVEQDPIKSDYSSEPQEEDPVTIRELIPDGEENAVDITDELWEDILRDEMLDIVEQDPAIKRDGFSVYK